MAKYPELEGFFPLATEWKPLSTCLKNSGLMGCTFFFSMMSTSLDSLERHEAMLLPSQNFILPRTASLPSRKPLYRLLVILTVVLDPTAAACFLVGALLNRNTTSAPSMTAPSFCWFSRAALPTTAQDPTDPPALPPNASMGGRALAIPFRKADLGTGLVTGDPGAPWTASWLSVIQRLPRTEKGCPMQGRALGVAQPSP
mmetsp:Transcript_31374/g.100122  ORF Transcript_31374/g.100122 Transcript_31374/m.100122 type:complete len:200 (-) Transcript_31374:145-744(-)